MKLAHLFFAVSSLSVAVSGSIIPIAAHREVYATATALDHFGDITWYQSRETSDLLGEFDERVWVYASRGCSSAWASSDLVSVIDEGALHAEAIAEGDGSDSVALPIRRRR